MTAKEIIYEFIKTDYQQYQFEKIGENSKLNCVMAEIGLENNLMKSKIFTDFEREYFPEIDILFDNYETEKYNGYLSSCGGEI